MSLAFRESVPFLLSLFVGVLLLGVVELIWEGFFWVWVLGTSFLLILMGYVVYFFRDPERQLPTDETIIVSAADGLVVGVEEIEDTNFYLGKMKRVSVFLSVFDVHVNRVPFAGKMLAAAYKPGEFLDVRHPECSLRNEYMAWKLETVQGVLVVRQIAGLIARRIVPWAKPGQALARGERFGMIRFGSRTEVYLPLECTVLVKIGDRVQGAVTPIARW